MQQPHWPDQARAGGQCQQPFQGFQGTPCLVDQLAPFSESAVLGLSRCLPGIALRYAALAGGATLAGILALLGIATTTGATGARVATGWAIVMLLMLAGWGLDSWRARRSASPGSLGDA